MLPRAESGEVLEGNTDWKGYILADLYAADELSPEAYIADFIAQREKEFGDPVAAEKYTALITERDPEYYKKTEQGRG